MDSSLVRVNGAVSPNISGGDNNNGSAHHDNYNQSRQSRTHPTHQESFRRDPQSLLAQVQRSVASFQIWAAKVLRASEDSSTVNWVQNARVARTFAMIINGLLAVFSLVLIGVEMVEMVVREPLLDYLLPESEISLIVAGFTVAACAFGFAVAYNLLVEDTTCRSDSENGNDSGGNGGGIGPRTPIPPRSTNDVLAENSSSPSVVQQTMHPRLMFTRTSTYLLTGNAVVLLMLCIAFMTTIVQRSGHLSQMNKELNNAWTDGFRHRTKLISDFELRHHCCGFNSPKERAIPEKCSENEAYGFQVPCVDDLAKDFGRWQKGIQYLLLTQLAMLLPLLALIFTLSAIGIRKLQEWKQQGLASSEAQAEVQAEATATVPVMGGRVGAQYERPLLEDVAPHHERTPLLVNTGAESVRLTHDQPSLI
ncbi:hypothetical protein KVV02_005578 [Mortierella alpina]|uniref:Uncharacterized protein n=1 Tax=Mortierella alpina TaxID=64518 RepID=A0A9P8A472_MORAP|nr:hypothetical protein KVV02_005578 [Mortierella alpina]